MLKSRKASSIWTDWNQIKAIKTLYVIVKLTFNKKINFSILFFIPFELFVQAPLLPSTYNHIYFDKIRDLLNIFMV